jgi:hypothetical protein
VDPDGSESICKLDPDFELDEDLENYDFIHIDFIEN